MLDFSRPAAFSGVAANQKASQQQQQQQASAQPKNNTKNDDDEDDDSSPRAQPPPSTTSFRPAPLAPPPRAAAGPYANFLQSANILGIAPPVAVPPPASPVTLVPAIPASKAAQQQQQQQRENVQKSGGFSQDALSANSNTNNNTAAPTSSAAAMAALCGEDRSKLSRDALQRQLESFGISEALDGSSVGGSNSEAADPLKGLTHDERIHFVPRTLMNCKLSRVKGGFFDGNVYFSLEAEQGRHFLVTGRKRTRATANFLISNDWNDMHRAGESFIGKVRGNESKTVYAIYDNGESIDKIGQIRAQNVQASVIGRNMALNSDGTVPGTAPLPKLRCELGYIIYQTNFGGSSGPRKMIVIVPKRDPATGQPLRQFQPTRPEDTMFEAWKVDPAQFWTLETKEGVWNEALRSYQLNFKGRVKCQSVKNFQLVEASQPARVVLQVGKRGEDDFVCDFQAPLNSMLAFAVAMTAFDGNFVRE